MKLVLTLLGVVLLVIAAVYVLVPADQLPGFFPGYEAGVTRGRLDVTLAWNSHADLDLHVHRQRAVTVAVVGVRAALKSSSTPATK